MRGCSGSSHAASAGSLRTPACLRNPPSACAGAQSLGWAGADSGRSLTWCVPPLHACNPSSPPPAAAPSCGAVCAGAPRRGRVGEACCRHAGARPVEAGNGQVSAQHTRRTTVCLPFPPPPLPCHPAAPVSSPRRRQLAIDLRNEFTAVMAEAAADGDGDGDDQGGAWEGEGHAQLASVLPLLSLTTTALSFATLTRVLFRIAFRYRWVGGGGEGGECAQGGRAVLPEVGSWRTRDCAADGGGIAAHHPPALPPSLPPPPCVADSCCRSTFPSYCVLCPAWREWRCLWTASSS